MVTNDSHPCCSLPRRRGCDPEFPWEKAGRQTEYTLTGASANEVQLFLPLLSSRGFMLVSVKLHRGRALLPAPNTWLQPEELL